MDAKTLTRHQLITIPAGRERTELVRYLGTCHGALRVQRLTPNRKELTIDITQVLAVAGKGTH
jgi:hypothetical protein